MGPKRRKRTATSEFGTSGRVSHDSSRFYNSRLHGEARRPMPVPDERPVPQDALGRIIHASSERMVLLPDHCIHLMITSPPYNVPKEYDEDFTLGEYRSLLRNVFAESYRVLVPGGRACVNIANVGRKPYIPLHAFVVNDMLRIGFRMRGEIIWNKAAGTGASTAWGSWKSASNPTLRDIHEYILVFSKGSFKRSSDRPNSISRDEFL